VREKDKETINRTIATWKEESTAMEQPQTMEAARIAIKNDPDSLFKLNEHLHNENQALQARVLQLETILAKQTVLLEEIKKSEQNERRRRQ